jgi:hypothetical protein
VALAMVVVACGGNKTTAPSPTTDGQTPAPTPRPATLIGLTFDRPSLTGGQTATAMLRLSSAAPDGGLAVALSSSAGILTAPASVTVSAGQASTEVSITTSITPTDTTVVLTASAGGVLQDAKIDVYAQAMLDSLVENVGAKYLWAGGPAWYARGTVRGVAPALTIIELRSANPAALEPSGLLQLARGDTWQKVQLIAKPVADDTPATITASSGGETRRLEAVVTAPPAVRIISDPGDIVGLGKTQVQSDVIAMIRTTGRAICGGQAISFTVPSPEGGEWMFNLAAPRGSVLRAGGYDNAVSSVLDQSRPTYFVYLNGRSCPNAATGRFVIDLIDYETTVPSGALHRFRGVIESQCGGAGFRAEISINDPSPRLVENRCS